MAEADEAVDDVGVFCRRTAESGAGSCRAEGSGEDFDVDWCDSEFWASAPEEVNSMGAGGFGD